jgi:hypothetical protein
MLRNGQAAVLEYAAVSTITMLGAIIGTKIGIDLKNNDGWWYIPMFGVYWLVHPGAVKRQS